MVILTVIIAILTVVSVIISLMSLTINAAEVVAPTTKENMIYLAWGIGFLMAYVCFYIVSIILERNEYIPKNPHLSRIKRYTKYSRSRFGSCIVIYILLFLFGIIFAFTSFMTCNTDDFSVIMRADWLLATIISLGILTGIIFGIGIYHKYRLHVIYFTSFIPLIITLLIWGAYTNPIISAIQHPLIQILLMYWICVCLISIYNLIKNFTVFLDSNFTLKDWYEYESDTFHTGIIVIIDPHRFGYLADDGVKRLARHYMNDRKQPYRVYFCFKKEHVINTLAKDTVIDFFMFGYFHERDKPIYSEIDYFNSGLADSKFHGKTFDQMLYYKKNVKSLIDQWKIEQDPVED